MVLRKTLFLIFSKIPAQRPRPLQFCALILFFLVFLQVYSIDEIDVRAVRGSTVVVAAKSKSPAVYAFEDVHASFETSNNMLGGAPVLLKAGDFSRLDVLPKVVKNHLLLKKNYRLKGITLTAPKKTEKMVRVANHPVEKREDFNPSRVQSVSRHRVGLDLPERESPTLQQKLSQLVENELTRRKLLASENGSRIVESVKSPVHIQAYNQGTSQRGKFKNSLISAKQKKFYFSQKSNQPIQLTLKGQIQMSGGLGFTGLDDSLAVYHVDEGHVLSSGEIDLEQGSFKIDVEQLNGYLVAELRDDKEDLIGYAELSMFDLSSNTLGSKYNLVLEPIQDGIITRVVSFKSFGSHKILVPGAEIQNVEGRFATQPDGQHRLRDVLPGSTMLVQAHAKGHWNSLGVSQYGFDNELRLFPKTLMKAFASIVYNETEQEISSGGVLWGRVLKEGKPVSGATVELAGREDIKPIYFSSYIPDVQRVSTSGDGYFAFAKLADSLQAVRAFYQGEVFPAQVVPTEKGAVTYVELKHAKKRKISFHVKDPFLKNNGVKTKLSILGLDIDHYVESAEDLVLNVPMGDSALYLESNPGGAFVQTRHTLSPKSRHFSVNLIQQSWIYRLLQRQRINISPDTGIIVGFVNGDDYRVEVDGSRPKSIVYFDSAGRLVRTPVEGGGFTIFNVEYGVRNLAVYAKSHNKVYNEMILPDHKVVNVSNVELRVQN